MERLPSGSYRVRVYAGTDPLTGKEIRLKATAKTAEHTQAELARLLEPGMLAVAAVKATSVSVEIPASGTGTAGKFQQKSIWTG